MEAWFISDLHLKNPEERNSQKLLRFLRYLKNRLKQQPLHLFLLGDIFDLWVGPHRYFADRFPEIIDALRELTQQGAAVTFIEGNHDVHIEGFFKKIGVKVFVEAQYYDIDGYTIRVEHGDLINLEDVKYLKYRSLIRHPFIKPLGYILPGKFWASVGERASKKSRARTGEYQVTKQDELQNMIIKHTSRAYVEKHFDYIISGHMHIRVDHSERIGMHLVRTINLGSWFEEPVQVFKISNGVGEWVELESLEGGN